MFSNMIAVTLLVLNAWIVNVSCERVTINSKAGSIAGYSRTLVVDNKLANVTTFLSIPFAETTAGENRFKKPIPKPRFNDTFEATSFPLGCIQSSEAGIKMYGQYVNFTEDCLTLNVYVPHDFSQTRAPLPIMAWIYGGGFVEGATGFYGGEGLSIQGDVILVTINYRVGVLGFLRSADGQLIGNQGLWDQHLALKWIHDNIAAFNGDPSKVTIFGESAGGASVIYQSLYPGNRGLFQRVIAESGTALSPWALMNGPNAEQFINYTGCNSGTVNAVECLRRKVPDQLQYNERGRNATIKIAPVVDGEFVIDLPKNIMFGNDSSTADARNFFASLDVIIGVNNYDGVVFFDELELWIGDVNNFTRQQWTDGLVPLTVNQINSQADQVTKHIVSRLIDFEYTDWSHPEDPTFIRESAAKLASDNNFYFPGIMVASVHAALGRGRTYFYEFSATPSRHILPTPDWVKGSNHADELLYVFGYPLYDSFRGNFSDADKSIARLAISFWSEFARNGRFDDVGVGAQQSWPEYNSVTKEYINIFNDHTSVQSGFYPRRMALWEDLIPDVMSLNHHD